MRQPFFVKSRKAWYVWIDGKQKRLAGDKKRAFEKYYQLLNRDEVNGDAAVVHLLDLHLDWLAKRRSAKTYQWYKDHLTSFAKSIGTSLPIGDLKPNHVTRWVDGQQWSNNTKHRAIGAVQRVFNWARKEGYIARSPIETVEKPEISPRDIVVEESHYRQLLEITDDAGKDLWSFLWETGARVQEARVIHTDHFEQNGRRLVMPRSKAKGKKRARVIYLNDVAFEIVKRRVAIQGEGYILRSHRGKPWTKEAIKNRANRELKKFDKQYCATAFRHTFCTRALISGIDPISVAELLSHSNLNMVANNYSHLCKNPSFLQDQLTKVK